MRFFTVPNAKAARGSVVWAMFIIGFFYLLTTFIGFGARAVMGEAGVEAAGTGGNLAAPNLALELGGGAGTFGGDLFLAVIAGVAFATILAVVAGLVLSASGAVAHDIWSSIIRKGKDSEKEEVVVAKIAAASIGAIAIIVAVIGGEGLNVSFMVGLAFAIAASANFPALLLALTWRRFNTTGAVTGVVVGVVSAIVLIILSPNVWPGAATDTGTPLPFTLANPGIISIPLGFLGCCLGTVLSTREGARSARSPSCTSGRRPDWAPRRRCPGALGFRAGNDRTENETHMADGATLDQELEQLLEQETFPPPDEFREAAVVSDPSIYDEAEADPEGFWAEQAEALHWFREVGPGARLVEPAVRQVVRGRASSTSPTTASTATWRPAGATGSPSTGAARRARSATSPTPSSIADVQRFANALKDRGIGAGDVVGIFLPMIPEVAVAMLACARIGAVHNVVFGGFSAESVRERMEFSEAKALITVDGARRKGKTAPIKAAGRRGRCPTCRASSCSTPAPTRRWPDKDAWFHELMEAADAECPAEPLDAEHPLFILYTSGSTAKPKGILHTTGGYLTQRRVHAQGACSTSSRTRTSTGARPTSAGSPGTPTSSTGRSPTARRRSCTRARRTTRTRTSGGSCARATA